MTGAQPNLDDGIDLPGSANPPPSNDAQLPASLLGATSPLDSLVSSVKSKAENIIPKLTAARDSEAQNNAAEANAEVEIDKKYREQLADIYKNYKPDTVDFGGKPNAPEQNPLKQFGSLASVLGIFASAFTKKPIVNALNASASAMNAARAGDTEAYNNAYQSWKDNIDLGLKKNKEDHEFIEDKLEEAKTDQTAALAEIKAYAAANNWPAASLLAQAGDLEGLARLSKSLETAGGKTRSFKDTIATTGVQEFIEKNKRPPDFKEMAQIQKEAEGKTTAEPGISDEDYASFDPVTLARKGNLIANGGSYAEAGISLRTAGSKEERAVDRWISENRPGVDLAEAKTKLGAERRERNTIAARSGQLKIIGEFAKEMIPETKDLAEKVLGDNWRFLNAGYVNLLRQSSNPDEQQLGENIYTIANAQARALNPSGQVTDTSREAIYHNLAESSSLDAFDATLDRIGHNIDKEQNVARKALEGTPFDPEKAPSTSSDPFGFR